MQTRLVVAGLVVIAAANLARAQDAGAIVPLPVDIVAIPTAPEPPAAMAAGGRQRSHIGPRSDVSMRKSCSCPSRLSREDVTASRDRSARPRRP